MAAEARELFDSPRALCREELAPDFEPPHRPMELTRQSAGCPQAVNIQSYN